MLKFFAEEEKVKRKAQPTTFVEKFLQVCQAITCIPSFSNNI